MHVHNAYITTYRICHGYRGVSRHRKLAGLTPSSSPRKQRPQVKDIEKILLVVQYPVVNSNVTTLLNYHPNLAIAYNTQLLDKAAGKLYHGDSQGLLPQSLSVNKEENLFIDVITDQLRQSSTPIEKKQCVKVIGEGTGFTLQDLNYSRFQTSFQSRLKTILNLFHLPVSVLFVNTAPLHRKQQSVVDTLKSDTVARTANISVLTLKLQHLSPGSFMERVCTFLRLSCSWLDHVDLAAVRW